MPIQRLTHLFVGLAACLSLGCEKDEIRRYQVPRLEQASREPSRADKSPQRLLGAIIPHGDRVWFFKLSGAEKAVGEHKEAFDGFINSVRFVDTGSEPITWKVPAGWQQQPGAQLRYATLRLGSKEEPLELTVIPLGKEAAPVLANVNRWRGQIGLPPITEAELASVSKEMKLDGATATLVDMTGPGAGK